MKTIFLAVIITVISAQANYSQWATKFTSAAMFNGVVSGWMNFEKVGDQWENRMYYLDATSFNVMSDVYSNQVQYSYNFTADEILAGYQLYSLRYDVTGDNYVDFYVMSYSGMSTNYRQGFKILDLVNGISVFEKKETNYSYSYPVIWDMDGDKILECVVTKTEYPGAAYFYQEIYNTGISTVSSFNQESLPAEFELKQNYPNPFNPSTTIEFNLNNSTNVKLDIFDVQGSLVKTLFSGTLEQGNHQIKWDGRTDAGIKTSSGIYFYRLNADEHSDNKKMIVLK
jgi:hypothetical protein